MARFTAETAADMAKKSHEPGSKRFYVVKAVESPQPTAESAEEEPEITPNARFTEIERQIAQCDKMIAACRSAKAFAMLTKAKESLWKLIYPTAGVLRPKNNGGQASRPGIE